jgi:iron complex transport system permease protein
MLLAALSTSCNKPAAPTSNPTAPTVASMVPAATDLLIGMGEKSHLVAVSNYDDIPDLPRAGDYETVDWELLRLLHPSVLVSQIKPELQSAGFKTKAADLHILPINIQIENLQDIFTAMDTLGDVLKDPARAAQARQQMKNKLDAVRARVAGAKPVRTLIFTGPTAEYIAAPGGFLDDLLVVAGGVNAAPASANHWPKIDREMLLSLKPDAILQLMPAAPQQERDQAAAMWKRLPQIPAVTTGRVYPIYAEYALQPGWHVTDLAEQFSQCLHPSSSPRPPPAPRAGPRRRAAPSGSSMKRWSPARLLMTLGFCLIAWAVVATACVCVGSTTPGFRWPSSDLIQDRAQVVLLASLIGAALSGAGVVYQAILRNPLADPYLLGVSSGASLCAYLWRFVAVTVIADSTYAMSQQAFSFTGALLAIAIVFTLSMRRGRLEPITLLLVGVIVNSINGSIFLLLNSLKRDITGGSGGPLNFLVGGIQTSLLPSQEYAAATGVAVCWAVLIFISGQLNVAVLSEAEATALGIRIHRLRWVGLITASLMTAAVVAISGPIGFVGLVCPHVARLIVGTDQRRLLPVATAMGAALLAIADALSRHLAYSIHTVLPVGVLTGLLGGPFYLALLYKARHRR